MQAWISRRQIIVSCSVWNHLLSVICLAFPHHTQCVAALSLVLLFACFLVSWLLPDLPHFVCFLPALNYSLPRITPSSRPVWIMFGVNTIHCMDHSWFVGLLLRLALRMTFAAVLPTPVLGLFVVLAVLYLLLLSTNACFDHILWRICPADGSTRLSSCSFRNNRTKKLMIFRFPTLQQIYNHNQNELYCQVCLHIRWICFRDRSFDNATEWQWQNKNTDNK